MLKLILIFFLPLVIVACICLKQVVHIQSDKYPQLLQGIWAFNKNENALFFIKRDSIYYVEHLSSPVKYNLKGDTLLIHYEGFTTRNLILKLDQDSLVFATEIGGINRLYRRKIK